MTEVLFYHLQRQPLEVVLPRLLEKTLERGWKAVVRLGSNERLQALDQSLWTYSEESFLPHGAAADGDPATQPVLLTLDDERPNGADCAFIADGAALPAQISDYVRVVLLFDGNDDEAVSTARLIWKNVKSGGRDATYWQQNDEGRWEKKA